MLSQKTILSILECLAEKIPTPTTELVYRNPYELLVATILSAQCTDKRVNMVTPKIFEKYPTPKDMAAAPVDDIRELIKSINFFNNKAVNLKGMAQGLVEKFASEVPQTLEELTSLPGVGRKTANVILGTAFKIPALAVDTHVHRVVNRLGIVKTKTPEQTERELMKVIPKEWWADGHHLFILHGRYTCIARKPKCSECPLRNMCVWYEENKEDMKKYS